MSKEGTITEAAAYFILLRFLVRYSAVQYFYSLQTATSLKGF